ncbi:MAG: hypothetical protein H6684_13550 [Deltaproteobacteria bacterium]|nr:hypothetical protein [Deltaproteobacteria bacterium]MCB9489752.1 hypothetical protein [Deltaproteobacteria bacterium]
MTTIRPARLRLQARYARVAICLLALILIDGCSKDADRSTGGDSVSFMKIKRTKISGDDRDRMLRIARGTLEGKAVDLKESDFPRLFDDRNSGVFVSASRDGNRALTGFATAGTVYDALVEAAKDLKTRDTRTDFSKALIRVDVVSNLSKTRSLKTRRAVRGGATRRGYYFMTDPPVAFLPQELRDYGILTEQRGYKSDRLKSLLRNRGLSKDIAGQLGKDDEVAFARFTTKSFIESEPGGEALVLYRGNRLNGYDTTPEALTDAIVAAGDYLKNAVRKDGEFEYRYYPSRNTFSRAYNMLRHGGTAFNMGQIYELTQDPEMLASLRRALEFLANNSGGPDPAQPDHDKLHWQAIRTHGYDYYKLGGAGLALLAFGTYTRVTGDMQYVPLMQDYARFIEYMMAPDGEVRHYYFFENVPQRVRDRRKPVLYYPGEAFFGLATLYKIDGNEHWMEVASRGIDWIADVRDAHKKTSQLEHDHWLMYAVNEVNAWKAKPHHIVHSRRVTEALMSKMNMESKYPDFVGGFYRKPRSTPAACRLEANSASYDWAMREGDKELAEQLFQSLLIGSQFLRRNQYDQYNTIFFPNGNKAIGGYMGSYWSPEIQIDYVQHATSALIGTRRIMLQREGKPVAPIEEIAEPPTATKEAKEAAEAAAEEAAEASDTETDDEDAGGGVELMPMKKAS